MHQSTALSILILVWSNIYFMSSAGTLKAGPLASSSLFGNAFGSSGWSAPLPPPITSTSTGFTGLNALQQGDAGQSLSLQASGDGLMIGLISNVNSDGFTNVGQSGGNSGQGVADVNDSVGASGIVPQSAIQLEMAGTDIVNLELDSHALGWEQVDSVVEHQAQVTGGDAGWGVLAPSGGWSATAGASSS